MLSDNNDNNYTPKTILITGIAGFIGSNCLEYLAKKYPNILFIGVDKLIYCSDLRNIGDVYKLNNFIYYQIDLNDVSSVDKLFATYNIDTIMHYAAYTHVDHSFENSLEFSKNNIIATHVLLEYAKRHHIKRFIYVSTDEIYGSSDNISDETSSSDPTNPYSATKCAAESIAKSYYHSFKLPIIITRGNNVYGPNQYPDKIIPLFTLNLFKNKKSFIHGSGLQKRSFLHVYDVAKAFEVILFKGKIGEIYNIGSDNEINVLEIAHNILSIVKPGEKFEDWFDYGQDRPFNDQRYYISSEKIKSLGWNQTISFDTGLNMTINWYKDNIKRWHNDNIHILIPKNQNMNIDHSQHSNQQSNQQSINQEFNNQESINQEVINQEFNNQKFNVDEFKNIDFVQRFNILLEMISTSSDISKITGYFEELFYIIRLLEHTKFYQNLNINRLIQLNTNFLLNNLKDKM